MDSKRQRFLPLVSRGRRRRHRRVLGTAVDHYAKFVGTLQPTSKVQGGYIAFLYDLKVAVVVTSRNNVVHLFALRSNNLCST